MRDFNDVTHFNILTLNILELSSSSQLLILSIIHLLVSIESLDIIPCFLENSYT